MSKHIESDLKEACLDWGNHYHNTCLLSSKQEDISIQFDKWWAERNKPAKKIIDLIPLLESGIDCEFSDKDHTRVDAMGVLGAIDHRVSPNEHPYVNEVDGTAYRYCRPRMNHTMFHNGGECPLPKGFKLRIYFRGSAVLDKHLYLDRKWLHTDTHFSDVIGYEILGLADGYAYPWEQAE